MFLVSAEQQMPRRLEVEEARRVTIPPALQGALQSQISEARALPDKPARLFLDAVSKNLLPRFETSRLRVTGRR